MTESALVREPTEPSLPKDVFVAEPRPSHRPRSRYRARIGSKEDVETARRAGLAVSLFEPERSESLGYPLSFKPRLLVAKSLVGAVDTKFPTISFSDERAARDPQLEDYVVAMLRIDTLGARRIARENRKRIDQARLLKRVLQEDLEARAYRVRLDEFAPGLPEVGHPISREGLEIEDRRDFGRSDR